MSARRGIELQHLTKRFATQIALAELSLSIPSGQAFGLVGASGAGKSTLLKVLVGMPASEGEARVLGLHCVDDRVRLRRRLGYAPETPFFYDYLKGWEVLRFAGEMHGLVGSMLNDTVSALFDWLAMSEAAENYVRQYSPTMKKKLALAAALVHEPEVLLVDEPTGGLPEAESEQIAELLESCQSSGRTILLTTKSMALAQQVCDAVGVLREGRLLGVGAAGAAQRALFAMIEPTALRGASPSALS